MSRSYYHTPIMGVTGRPSCKSWRTQQNRRYRAYWKNLMRHGKYDDIQDYKGKFGNEWDSPRDGRTYFGEMKYRECIEEEYDAWIWTYDGNYKCVPNRNLHFCYEAYLTYMRK